MDLKTHIPSPFPRLNGLFPGIMPSTYYCVTANTGVGKTQFAKAFFVSHAAEYAEKNGIDLKIVYFALEESIDDFYDTMRIREIRRRYGFKLDLYALAGYRGKLSPEVIAALDEVEPYIETLKKYIEVYDTIYNPTGIYKQIAEVARQRGQHTYHNVVTGEKYSEQEYRKLPSTDNIYYDSYIPNNPNELVVIVVDHINILSKEKGASTLAEAMAKLSTEYLLHKVVKKFGYAVVSVQQQALYGEGLDYVKANKLLPSEDKLGNNKEISRDYHIMLGLFAPYKHKNHLPNYDYNLNIFQDNLRVLNVFKHRKGKNSVEIPLLFDGAGQIFEELPLPNSQLIPEIERKIKDKREKGLL